MQGLLAELDEPLLSSTLIPEGSSEPLNDPAGIRERYEHALDLIVDRYFLAHSGKVAIIDFWATWCEPCIAEIPKFNQLHDQYPNIQVIGITVMSPHDDIKPKVQEVGMKYTVLVGNDDVADGFGGLIGFPTTFVVTKDWKIYKKYLGALPNKQDRIRQDIEKLLAAEDHAD